MYILRMMPPSSKHSEPSRSCSRAISQHCPTAAAASAHASRGISRNVEIKTPIVHIQICLHFVYIYITANIYIYTYIYIHIIIYITCKIYVMFFCCPFCSECLNMTILDWAPCMFPFSLAGQSILNYLLLYIYIYLYTFMFLIYS